jgi:hypothetical protein
MPPMESSSTTASLSARQAEAAGLLTSGTYGRTSSTSSASAALADALANRLRPLTASLGSTLYKLTWKARVTPQRRLIYALRASAPRISANGFIGWPTPETCKAANDTNLTASGDGRTTPNKLGWAASLSGWPTPCQQDGPNGGPAQGADRLPGAAGLSSWATPAARDWKGGTTSEATVERNSRIEDTAQLTLDGPARLTARGEMLTGYSAGMESGGQLNPRFSLWLQGFPIAWASCGEQVTRSSSRKRRPSSGVT